MSETYVASWRIILAFLLDLITGFVVIGWLVAWATGSLTQGGFSLNGGPALLFFALLIGYFVVFNRYLGGTIWKRILGAVRRR